MPFPARSYTADRLGCKAIAGPRVYPLLVSYFARVTMRKTLLSLCFRFPNAIPSEKTVKSYELCIICRFGRVCPTRCPSPHNTIRLVGKLHRLHKVPRLHKTRHGYSKVVKGSTHGYILSKPVLRQLREGCPADMQPALAFYSSSAACRLATAVTERRH
jgi:hypothetical protein